MPGVTTPRLPAVVRPALDIISTPSPSAGASKGTAVTGISVKTSVPCIHTGAIAAELVRPTVKSPPSRHSILEDTRSTPSPQSPPPPGPAPPISPPIAWHARFVSDAGTVKAASASYCYSLLLIADWGRTTSTPSSSTTSSDTQTPIAHGERCHSTAAVRPSAPIAALRLVCCGVLLLAVCFKFLSSLRQNCCAPPPNHSNPSPRPPFKLLGFSGGASLADQTPNGSKTTDEIPNRDAIARSGCPIALLAITDN